MSSETLINTACNPTPLLPGSGLETKLQLHHNGVMTYSHYVNGSIFSVPKFEVVAKNNHNSTGFDVMGHPVKASDHLVETVYGLVKFFLGWDYLFNDLKINMNFYFLIRKTTLRFVSGRIWVCTLFFQNCPLCKCWFPAPQWLKVWRNHLQQAHRHFPYSQCLQICILHTDCLGLGLAKTGPTTEILGQKIRDRSQCKDPVHGFWWYGTLLFES